LPWQAILAAGVGLRDLPPLKPKIEKPNRRHDMSNLESLIGSLPIPEAKELLNECERLGIGDDSITDAEIDAHQLRQSWGVIA